MKVLIRHKSDLPKIVLVLAWLLCLAYDTEHATAQVLPPEFGSAHGVYFREFALTLRPATPLTDIIYTTDGSEPNQSNGTVYRGRIPITHSVCVRAAAHDAAMQWSPIVTQTYLVNISEGIHSLPILSLAGDTRHTFYLPNGICAVQGGTYTSHYVSWNPVTQEDYNHPLGHGLDYERPVSAELFFPSGETGFSADCGIRVSGSTYTRSRYRLNSKFSFRLYFRKDYGMGQLTYPLIPQAPVASLDCVVLRAGQSDKVNPFIKDELSRRLQRDMSGDACLGMFVNLFVNGDYKGYYNPCERIDEDMFQARYAKDFAWDVVSHWRPEDDDLTWQPGDSVDRPYYFDVRDGDPNSMNALLDYAITQNLNDSAHYQYVVQRLDIPWFIDYLILEGYLHNRDWPHNNWTAARERSARDLGRWRFYAWDLEHSFYDADLAQGFKEPSVNNTLPINILYGQLKDNESFRQLFADRVQSHFFNGGALQAAHVVARFEVLRDIMAGDLPQINTFIADRWAAERPEAVLSSLKSKGLFNFEGPRVLVNGMAYTGQILFPDDVFTLENPHATGVLWVTLDGTDPRVSLQDHAITPPPPSVSISPTAMVYDGYEIHPSQYTVLKARILDQGVWSGLSRIELPGGPQCLINEVMTDNQTTLEDWDEPGEYPDWIELYNPTSGSIDLGGMCITDDPNRPLQNPLPEGLVIKPFGVLILWADGDPEEGPTHLSFKLSRNGEALGLYHPGTCQWIDFVTVVALPTDHSYKRSMDGQGHWTVTAQPTPGYLD